MAAVQHPANNPDSEVHITYEDQQQINTFARFNARLQDMREDLESKKKDLQNLNDAGDEILMCDDDTVPYQIGEVFVIATTDDATSQLEAAKEAVEKDISDVQAKCEQHKGVLSDLKVKLYAKFGTNINLEADED